MALSIPTSFAIRTYEGKDEWGSKKYLAHMNLGNDLYMSFFGATAKEAEERARNWYATETAKYKRIDKSEPEAKADEKFMEGSQWGNSDWSKPADGRGQHFAGKIWMVKHMADGTKDKKRVDPSELSKYIELGYIKGGPRS